MIPNTQAYILEQATVDPSTKVMHTTTRNLNHTRAMAVIESQTFRVHPDNSNWYRPPPCPLPVREALLLTCHTRTQVVTEARIVSQVGWGLKSRVEQFGLSRFQSSTEKARMHPSRTYPASAGVALTHAPPPGGAVCTQSRQALRYTLNAIKQKLHLQP